MHTFDLWGAMNVLDLHDEELVHGRENNAGADSIVARARRAGQHLLPSSGGSTLHDQGCRTQSLPLLLTFSIGSVNSFAHH